MRIGVLISLCFLLVAMGIQSCTLKKRVYRPGYFIVWKHKSKTNGNKSETETAGRIEPKSSPPGTTTKKDKPSTTPPAESSEKEPSLTEYTEQVKKQKNKKPATKDVNTSAGQKKQ